MQIVLQRVIFVLKERTILLPSIMVITVFMVEMLDGPVYSCCIEVIVRNCGNMRNVRQTLRSVLSFLLYHLMVMKVIQEKWKWFYEDMMTCRWKPRISLLILMSSKSTSLVIQHRPQWSIWPIIPTGIFQATARRRFMISYWRLMQKHIFLLMIWLVCHWKLITRFPQVRNEMLRTLLLISVLLLHVVRH